MSGPLAVGGGSSFVAAKTAQAANFVYAGPVSAPAALPAFRALVEADIPALSAYALAAHSHTRTWPLLNPTTSADNVVQAGGAAVIPLVVKGAAAQSANLQEWQDSTGAVLSRINSAGSLSFNGAGADRGGAISFLYGGSPSNGWVLGTPDFYGGRLSITPLGGNAMAWASTAGWSFGPNANTSIAHPVQIDVKTATANAVSNAFAVRLAANTVTPTVGFGVAVALYGQSSTTANRDMARIRAEWTEATDASRKSKLVLSTYNVASEVNAVTILHNGNVGIGTTTPATTLHAITADAATNAVTNVLTLGHNSSGTPAAGFGTGVLFQGESSTTENRDMARRRALWNVATDASRLARTVDSVWNIAAETDVLGQSIDGADVADTQAYHFGRPNADGSWPDNTWRIVRSGNNLVMERRESGAWVTKQTVSA